MHGSELLDFEFFCSDLDRKISIRNYFKELLCKLIEEEEGFSGKRPFGNSGWVHDLVKALVQAKAIKGTYDEEYDSADDYSWGEFYKVIFDLIVEHM